MKLSAIIHALEQVARPSIQEGWDNSGLQIGLPDGQTEVTGVLLCLDVTEAIIAEAVEKGCNLVVSHHPLIFKAFKSISGKTPQQRAAMAAIRAGVAVYSAHTSLDSADGGISYEMARMLGLKVRGVLAPSPGSAFVTVSFTCDAAHADDVQLALLDTGAEHVDRISATRAGLGTPAPDALPGEYDIDTTPLAVISAQMPQYAMQQAINAVLGTAAAQSDSFGYSVANGSTDKKPLCGLGVIGDFEGEGMSGSQFIDLLHTVFHTQCIKVSAAYRPDAVIRRVGLCGGSAPDFAAKAVGAGADIYVCGDIRYHDFADAVQSNRIIADIGHFESELCAKSIFYRIITNNFPNFAVYYSDKEENPVMYL